MPQIHSTQIGIAVVEWEGKFLVGVRPVGVPLAGFAEFPGGKCHSGESSAQCAQRECLEETGLRVNPVDLLHSVSHEYPHANLELNFWLCSASEPVPAPSGGFYWANLAEVVCLEFPPANAGIVELLKQRLPASE